MKLRNIAIGRAAMIIAVLISRRPKHHNDAKDHTTHQRLSGVGKRLPLEETYDCHDDAQHAATQSTEQDFLKPHIYPASKSVAITDTV